MPLLKKREMTEKQLAAIRRNQKLSHGASTDAGRGRIRAALLRHGFYAQAAEAAMRVLGEDPAQFQAMMDGMWVEFKPAGCLQEALVIRLARATWLMNRADRMQEGYALRQASALASGRGDRQHLRMMRLKMTAERLWRLQQSVAREWYVTTAADLQRMQSLKQEGDLKGMGEVALALFCELQAPGAPDGLDSEQQGRFSLNTLKDIFGLGSRTPPEPRHRQLAERGPAEEHKTLPAAAFPASPLEPPAALAPAPLVPQISEADAFLEAQLDRYPNISEAEWEARERPRQLLENILSRQVDICEEERQEILKESVKGLSPYERAAEIAPIHPDSRVMRRMQDSNFREVRRITSLLRKLKRQQHKSQALEYRKSRAEATEKSGA